jgi:mono/diheme cytochrome c family protein
MRTARGRHVFAIILAGAASGLTILASPPASAEADAKTVRLWKAKCASCHGVDGKAKTETGEKLSIPDMTSAAWQKKVGEAQMKVAILDGVKREGKPEGMDGFRDKLSPEQVDALVAFVRDLGK